MGACLGCGEKGHYKDKCPKARNQQNDGARARAYVVVENPQQNPNVVTGTFLLNDHYACILFDSGAEKSFVFISSELRSLLILPNRLNTSYEMRISRRKSGTSLDGIRIVRDFPEVFPDDLLGLPYVRELNELQEKGFISDKSLNHGEQLCSLSKRKDGLGMRMVIDYREIKTS
ncbi:putative reverse transcriptase domain-containing protein [Tanacetum coccineum]